MGALKDIWTRIEKAYSTSETSPSPPGAGVPPAPEEDPTAHERPHPDQDAPSQHQGH